VRHSLKVIFTVLAGRGATLAMPTDVYPVYLKIAMETKLRTVGFTSFPIFEVERILNAAAKAGAFHVLLPQPLKLQGRLWTDEETGTVEAWLRADRRRRILVDGVYGLGLPLDAVSQRLIETDQVLFLDSLSKGWLHELVFGVAVIPEQDQDLYSLAFRSLLPAPAKLLLANELLERFPDVPSQIAEELETRRLALVPRLARTRRDVLQAEHGYLVAVECSAEQLLNQHGIVAIPASAFGSCLGDWSAASALPSTDALS